MLTNIVFLKCNADNMDISRPLTEMKLLVTLNSQAAKRFICCVLCSEWDHKHLQNMFPTFH